MSNKLIKIGVLIVIMAFYAINSFYTGNAKANYAVDYMTNLFANTLAVEYSVIDEFVNKGIFNFRISNAYSYPPLYTITAASIIFVFGNKWCLMNTINNGIYLLILLIFSYLLGRKLKDEKLGIISAVLVSLYPLTYMAFGTYCSDFSLMGLTVMSVYFLLMSDNFNSTKYSVLLAVSCGWGMMLKQPFGAFIAGPLAYVALVAILNANRIKYKPLLNMLLFTMVAFIIIQPFYFKGNTSIKDVLFFFSREPDGNKWYNFANLRLFTIGLWESQLSLPFFIVLLCSIYYFIKDNDNRIKFIFFLWLLIPNLILIFMPHWKNERYLLAQQPLFALVSSFGIWHLLDKKYGKVVFTVIVCAGIIQYYDFKYDLIGLNKFKLFGSSYFVTHGSELDFNYKSLENKSNKVLGICEPVRNGVNELKQLGKEKNSYNLVYISDNGDFRDSQVAPESYLWFNGRINIHSMKGYEVIDHIFKNDKYPDIDFVLYVENRHGNKIAGIETESLFGIMKSNWIEAQELLGQSVNLSKNNDWKRAEQIFREFSFGLKMSKMYADNDINVYFIQRNINS